MTKEYLTSQEALKITGLTEDAAKALFLDDKGELKPEAPSLFGAKVAEKFTTIGQDQYNRGIREKGEAIEARTKPFFQKYGINAQKAEEAIEALVLHLEKAISEKPDFADLKAKLKTLPEFQQELDAQVAAINAQLAAKASELESFKVKVDAEKVRNTAVTKAFDTLKAKKAVFGPNPLNQIGVLLAGLSPSLKIEDGEIRILDKDGTPLRDEHKNQVAFDSWIVDVWTNMGFAFDDTQDPDPANRNRRTPPGNPDISKETDPKKRVELLRKVAKDLRK